MSDTPKPPLTGGQKAGIGCGVVVLALIGLTALGSDLRKPPEGDELAEISAAAVDVEADALLSAYRANVVGAKRRYGERPLRVSGTIELIGEDAAGEPYLDLTPGMPTVLAKFGEAGAPAIAELARGQVVTALCAESWENDGSVILDRCVLERGGAAQLK